jgi:phage tail-like protein
MTQPTTPLHVFRFAVSFREAPLHGGAGGAVELCRGAFSEVTGLEASVEPFTIKEGGRNGNAVHRMGRVSHGTVVLKRGMTTTRDLWTWFSGVTGGSYTHRLDVGITLQAHDGTPLMTWNLTRCLPTRFKVADLGAAKGEVGVEELHLVHEGFAEVTP